MGRRTEEKRRREGQSMFELEERVLDRRFFTHLEDDIGIPVVSMISDFGHVLADN